MERMKQYASCFGYYDGKIDPDDGCDLGEFLTPECTLTAHAPLWGTKVGEEEAVPAAEVRRRLARSLRWMRVARHEMHMALHPDGTAVCLFFVVKGRFFLLPFDLIKVPLLFVVNTANTPHGLRIHEIHEWPAQDPQAAWETMVTQLGWPAEAPLESHVAFGAAS
ncbi:MAG: hypothetical protein AB8I08_16370 [Sandaracinaceae bacterium]